MIRLTLHFGLVFKLSRKVDLVLLFVRDLFLFFVH